MQQSEAVDNVLNEPKNAAIVKGFAVLEALIDDSQAAGAAKEEDGQVLDRDLENVA